MTKTRLEAFSDGVLAIIITIMVLEMKVPHGSSWSDLMALWPIFISYAISFAYIGIYWGNHHHLLHSMNKITSGIMLANLNLLFWLSLIPFATAWMGENHFAENTVALYCLMLLMCAFAYYILQTLVVKHHLHPDEFTKAHKMQNQKGQISLLAYTLALLASYFYPLISGILVFAVAILWLIPDKNIEKVYK
ncbi:MAG: DUF1211 domain-containing protein [Saprospiraceae bacterium]|nr:DUF1211 domain-containing protein [Saprospiraceae bacterium]